jgi:hypothetical protein
MSSLPQQRASQTISEPSQSAQPDSSEKTDDPVSVAVGPNDSIAPCADQTEHEAIGDANAVLDKKKCWVCLTEEGEEDADGNPVNSGRWTHACACSLDAHESCLIKWINQSRQTPNEPVSHSLY